MWGWFAYIGRAAIVVAEFGVSAAEAGIAAARAGLVIASANPGTVGVVIAVVAVVAVVGGVYYFTRGNNQAAEAGDAAVNQAANTGAQAAQQAQQQQTIELSRQNEARAAEAAAEQSRKGKAEIERLQKKVVQQARVINKEAMNANVQPAPTSPAAAPAPNPAPPVAPPVTHQPKPSGTANTSVSSSVPKQLRQIPVRLLVPNLPVEDYPDEVIDELIRYYIARSPHAAASRVLMHIQLGSETEAGALGEELRARCVLLEPGVNHFFMPIGLGDSVYDDAAGGGHWALIHGQRNLATGKFRLNYFDPLGEPVDSDLRNAFNAVLHCDWRESDGERVQGADNSCGAWVIEAARSLGHHGVLPRAAEHIDIQAKRVEHQAKITQLRERDPAPPLASNPHTLFTTDKPDLSQLRQRRNAQKASKATSVTPAP